VLTTNGTATGEYQGFLEEEANSGKFIDAGEKVQSIDKLLFIILEVTVYYFRAHHLLFRTFPVLPFPFKVVVLSINGAVL